MVKDLLPLKLSKIAQHVMGQGLIQDDAPHVVGQGKQNVRHVMAAGTIMRMIIRVGQGISVLDAVGAVSLVLVQDVVDLDQLKKDALLAEDAESVLKHQQEYVIGVAEVEPLRAGLPVRLAMVVEDSFVQCGCT